MRARRPLALAATGLALALTLAACGASSDHGPMTGPSSSAASDQSGRTGDAAFAQLMIAHHQQAIEMADQALSKSTNPDITKLATAIKQAQGPEIDQMKGWLAAWGEPEQMQGATASDGSMDHSSMDMGGVSSAGMMTEQDMQTLSNATGKDFDRTWLQMMIAHHQGAVSMANEVLMTTSDPQVKDLADSVVAAQMEEISTMQKLLAG